MKHVYPLVFMALFAPFFSYGQTPLPESRRSSSELFVYKLNENDIRDLYYKGKGLDDSMLHTFVLSCAEQKDIPSLPRGNYISVKAMESKLEYSDLTVDNFYYSLVEDEKVMLYLSDTLGNVIDDAKVRCGLKRLKFDKATQTYNTSQIGDEKLVEVNNNGVLHYIEFEKYSGYYRNNSFRSIWWKIKNSFNRVFVPGRAHVRNKYDGFVVFSKPKYKSGETVRLKAYINSNGKPYRDEVDVALVSYYPERIDTVMTTLRPYRSGMYEWEFVLSDSLRLRLDNSYNVVFRTKGSNKNSNDIRGSFYYEEYELECVSFEAKADKSEYAEGEVVKLRFNTRDENNMPVYDGRVDIVVRPAQYRKRSYFSKSAFIPDEVWRHSLSLEQGEHAGVALPDSIFVDNTGMYYDIECSFFDSANEKQQQVLSVYMDMRDRLIDFSVEKGILSIREMAGGESVQSRALAEAYNAESEIIWRDSVMLPYSMPLLWMATDYSVTTRAASQDFYAGDIEDEIIGYRFFREGGDVRLVVDNPAGFPFWYTIRKDKHIIDKGYTAELDYSHRDKGKQGYSVQLSYLLGEEARTIQGDFPYVEKNITMEVNTPTTIYPGQTVPVKVAVNDKRGRPVKNADVTAFAFTSKFGPYSPFVTVFGKSRSGKPFDNQRYEIYEESPCNVRSPMDWNIWRQRMGLDSIEYYKFLYPEVYYSYSEKAVGGATQISPYVVIDGNLQGVHILYIDEQPHYFRQAEQLDIYSFPVTSGYHTLKFRTYDREIVADNIYVEEGAKTIVSVDGKRSAVGTGSIDGDRPVRTTVTMYEKENKGVLNDREIGLLNRHMITVDDTFGTAALSNGQSIDLPAAIHTGGVYYSLNNTAQKRNSHINRGYTSEPILVGPFPYRGFSTGGRNIGTLYSDTTFIGNFEIEGGYRYSIWNNYLKQQSWGKPPYSKTIEPFTPAVSFSRNALTANDVSEIFRSKLLTEVGQKKGIMVPAAMAGVDGCRLMLELGYFADKKIRTQPLFIHFSGEGEDSSEYYYYGATRNFEKLPQGKHRIDLIFSDSTCCSYPVDLRPDGLNYLKLDSIVPKAEDGIARKAFYALNSQLKVSFPSNPLQNYNFNAAQDSIATASAQGTGSFNSANYIGEVITGTVCDISGWPLIGATVMIEGTQTGTITNADGKFTLPDTGSGNLLITYLGFKPFTTRLISGYDYKITLEEDCNRLEEVVVGAYGTTQQASMTGSVISSDNSGVLNAEALGGKVAGVLISGDGAIANSAPPLIIVNGVPYDGALSDLDPDSMASLNFVEGANSTIYGARAANGVIFIETKDGISQPDKENIFPEGWNKASTLRTNFHDDAFWRPALSTDRDGMLTFEVTYPDDITNWNANFIAVGGRRQTDVAQLSIKSFKPLNAQLSLPQFAVQGDSLNAVGRLTNHLGDSVRIKRSIETDGYDSEENISLAEFHVDNIPVTANGMDSLRITYSLSMDSGYFDGERRTIPVYRQGVLESHGEFALLNEGSTFGFASDPALGPVTVHAEAGATQMFLDEIEVLDRYPYLCNEQMASKIKALLSKKRIFSIVGRDFKEGKKIENLIGKFQKNQNSDHLWGWWNRDETELWISKQIVEAVLDAQVAGYKADFNRQAVADALLHELDNRLSSAGEGNDIASKHNLLNLLDLLRKLDVKVDYAQYLSVVSSLPDQTLNDRLKGMEMMLALGTGEKPRTDSLLNLASETIMGSLYWEEKPKDKERGYSLMPNINTVENTLAAYRILRQAGGFEAELEKIRNYFFEIRKSGSWQNTYESSHILETIVPDMIASGSDLKNAAIIVNGRRFGEFPFTCEFPSGEAVEAKNEGQMPVFFTAYQQAWNKSPEAKAEGFSVETGFYEDGEEVSELTAGKSIGLKVTVSTDSDVEYVMIEVPIPAGCSYESKGKGNRWKETHREYHKEKTVIFCNRLPKGSHEFTINLIPRYSGSYCVNPAKIELMYYPTFFGRNNTRECVISD